jgi:anthranilate phosphoribosyltransferase
MIAGKAETLKEGGELALRAIGSGGALRALNGLIEISHG